MRPERSNIRLACARRDHHRYGIAGHDPQENENHDRHTRERNERHQEPPQNHKRDHRPVTLSPDRGPRRSRLGDRHPVAQAAGDTSVGCKAPDLFGMTLRSDL